ncbi:MAG: hypothetical protein MRJ65_09080 [Candidatus Brocadiaceae bacterium]|nr:hypothetical protein [Candidatus Brocadiaceae bacterium]
MKIVIFTLCQAANIDTHGNLNILGAFDVIKADGVPVIQPCMLALKLRFEKRDEGNKSIKFSFIDADGKKVLPKLEKKLTIKIPPNESYVSLSMAIPIPQLKLESFGNYSMNIAIDDHYISAFDVKLFQNPKN